MIVDFIGAPGVGKSTFARALTDRLQGCGCPVDFISSYRPAEDARLRTASSNDPAPGHIMAALRRLTRPATEILSNTGDLVGRARGPGIVEELMTLLPPTSFIWSIRLRQYIIRLAHSWRIAAQADHIILFDQGFAQAVSSLVVLGRPADRQHVPRALALIPKPDLLIHLTAPTEILAARLREREHRQGRLERLLELDLRTNLEFVQVIEELDELLRAQGHRVIHADCASQGSLSDEVEVVAGEVVAMFDRAARVRA